MLSFDFYMVNATTVLWWFLQNCSHEALLATLALGGVCMLTCVVLLVHKFVYVLYSILVYVFVFMLSVIIEIPLRPRHRSSSDENSVLVRSSNLLSDRSDSAVGIVSDRELNLPQHLAIHPLQWTEIEAIRAHAPSSESAQSTAVPVRPLLRRSRRTSRARVSYAST